MLKYYSTKLFHRLFSRLLIQQNGYVLKPGVVSAQVRGVSPSIKKIVFCFWDAQLVHLGDQLFHYLAIQALKNSFEIHVICHSAMKAYYQGLGVSVSELDEFDENQFHHSLMISKNDMLSKIYSRFQIPFHFLGMDYGKVEKRAAISETILDEIEQYLESQSCHFQLQKGAKFNFIESILLQNKKKNESSFLEEVASSGEHFYVYNPYVASNHLSARKRIRTLEKTAKALRSKGFQLLLVGSEKDLKSDSRSYDFIDQDGRGKLQPLELFNLFSLPNVKGLVSFDTFIAHVASLCEKELHIVMKSDKNLDFYRDKFIPMMPDKKAIVKECL